MFDIFVSISFMSDYRDMVLATPISMVPREGQ